jgi:hypothetical protein
MKYSTVRKSAMNKKRPRNASTIYDAFFFPNRRSLTSETACSFRGFLAARAFSSASIFAFCSLSRFAWASFSSFARTSARYFSASSWFKPNAFDSAPRVLRDAFFRRVCRLPASHKAIHAVRPSPARSSRVFRLKPPVSSPRPFSIQPQSGPDKPFQTGLRRPRQGARSFAPKSAPWTNPP